MVTSVMSDPEQGTREEATADMAVSEKMKETLEKERILELIACILSAADGPEDAGAGALSLSHRATCDWQISFST